MSSILKVNNIQNSGGTAAMAIDGSGRITQPANPAFIVMANDTGGGQWVTITTGQNYDVTFNTERVDRGNNFNTSTYRWTAPIDCIMMFGVQMYMDGASATYTRFRFYENNTTMIHEHITSAPENDIAEGAAQASVLLDVTAGRTYQWKLYKDASSPQVYYPISTNTLLRFCYCWGYMVA